MTRQLMTHTIRTDTPLRRAVVTEPEFGSATGTPATCRPGPASSLSRWIFLLALLAFCRVCAVASAQTISGGQAGYAATPTAPAASAPAENTSPMGSQSMLYPGEDFRLHPGDLISVSAFMQPDYQSTVRIAQNGTVQLPFIGSVPIEGLTVKSAQILIADRLRTGQFYRDPEIVIRVLDTVNGSIMVTGEMHATIPVSTERSLKDVLLTAGGLPANASHTVKIVRQGVADPIVVNLGTDLASSTTADIEVHPHDIIQITRASVVYVLGAFQRQGAVALDQASPLTLLQCAALSGGINFEGQYNDLRLIRTVGTDRKVIEVDIKKVRDGKAKDPILQANDIVFLPTNQMKAAMKSLGAGGVLGIVSLVLSVRGY
jgi:polysaccharide export outer membrane protein